MEGYKSLGQAQLIEQPSLVAEIQGLYGPVSISEVLIQKIWFKQNFLNKHLVTDQGLSLRVLHPGRWNLQEGPDFREAQIEIDGKRITGDVEIHFYPKDWVAHGHHRDAHFDDVVLHVSLFAGSNRPDIKTQSGHTPHCLTLLNYLESDIETIASEDALLALTHQNESAVLEGMLLKPLDARREEIQKRAQMRWRQKCKFARQRLAEQGWEEACHQYALEVLGYKRNRAPMSSIALKYPLSEMKRSELSAEHVFTEQQMRWRLSGLRPANHPKKRLRQYLELVSLKPDWPQDLEKVFQRGLLREQSSRSHNTKSFRSDSGLKGLRNAIKEEVMCGLLSSSRLDTMIIDAFLPLYAEKAQCPLYDYWQHWYVGDMPSGLTQFLKECEMLTTNDPASNGQYQGALQLFYEFGV